MAELIASTRAAIPQFRPARNLGVVVAASWLVLLVACAIASPLLPLGDPTQPDYTAILAGPGPSHLLGTDSFGRDLLARLIYGARISLLVGVLSVGLGLVLGIVVGLLAGYFKGVVQLVANALTDVVLAFPVLVLVSAIVAVRGASVPVLVVGLAIALLPTFARLTRANTIGQAQRDFVIAARVMGASSWTIVFREILPNVVRPLLAYAFIMMGVMIVAEGALSFLGLGIPPPEPTWGGMIADGRADLSRQPLVVFLPAFALVVTSLALNVVGEFLLSRSEKGAGARG